MTISVQLREADAAGGELPRLEIVAADFAEFVERYSAWISPDGLFVPTDLVLAKGLEVDVECQMEDGFRLFAGRCLVAWVRGERDALHRPAGIGMHFLDLDEGSRQFVEKVAENHGLAGGEAFDVDRERPRSSHQKQPSEERLHSMVEDQDKQREAAVGSLSSRGKSPVKDLSVGRGFAPGLDVGEIPVELKATHEFRAPVPRSVLDTLSGVSLEELQRREQQATAQPSPEEPGAGPPEADDGERAAAPAEEAADDLAEEKEGRPSATAATAATSVPGRQAERPGAGTATAAEADEEAERESASSAVERRASESSSDLWRRAARRAELQFGEVPRREPGTGGAASTGPSEPQSHSASSAAAGQPVSSEGAAGGVEQDDVASWDTGLDLRLESQRLQAPEAPVPASSPTPPPNLRLEAATPQSELLRIDPELLGEAKPSRRWRVSRRLAVTLTVVAVLAAGVWWVAVPGEGRLSSLLPWLADRQAGSIEEGGDAALEAIVAEGRQPARVLQTIEVEEVGGQTAVTLVFDGEVVAEALSDLRLPSGRPRHVIKIVGIVRPPVPTERDVDTTHVSRIRFGLHRIEGSAQVHAVFDLADPRYEVLGIRPLGDRLVVRVGDREASGGG